jgi:2-amino-4-hydroxy-6-hydroxymethyldihydropteridine diphosphokinase
MQSAPVRAYVALGANLGDPAMTLHAALGALRRLPDTTLAATSSLYSTRPVDADGPDYCNACAAIDTALEPLALLHALQAVEQAHGRQRPYLHAPRTLDLDLLLYGELEMNTPELTLPHPRMHLRAFVLAPLLEIAPAISIPGLGAARQRLAPITDQPIRKLP